MILNIKDKQYPENEIHSFLKKHNNTLDPPLDTTEGGILNGRIKLTKEKGDFILLLNDNNIIAYIGYHIYENFIKGKHNVIFIDLIIIDEEFRKNFLILKKLKLEFRKIIIKNKISSIQLEAYNKNEYLINMYSKLANKQKEKDNKTLFFINPKKIL